MTEVVADKRSGEAPPPYFGDHPHGAYRSADRTDTDAGDENPGDRRPPWVSEERSPANPYPLRMFAEDSCRFALWGPADEPPPTSNGVTDWGDLEDVLPISGRLRDDLLAWARDHCYQLDPNVSMDDFDERGFVLSRELQRELGDLYTVEYAFTFAGPHHEPLVEIAETEPLPGWRLRRP